MGIPARPPRRPRRRLPEAARKASPRGCPGGGSGGGPQRGPQGGPRGGPSQEDGPSPRRPPQASPRQPQSGHILHTCSRNMHKHLKKLRTRRRNASKTSKNSERMSQLASTRSRHAAPKTSTESPSVPQTIIFVASGERLKKRLISAQLQFAKFTRAFKACTRVQGIRPLCSMAPCKGPRRRPSKHSCRPTFEVKR